jgi:hypothetical protein
MPLLMTFLGGLLSILGSAVGRVLFSLAMGYVTYSGFDLAINWLLDQIKTNFNAMPAQIVSFLAWLWVDKAISMIFSAYSVALVVKLAGSTKLTKLVVKG